MPDDIYVDSGDAAQPSQGGNEFSEAQAEAPYTVWDQNPTYNLHSGLLFMPCTSGPHELLRTTEQPFGFKQVNVQAEREGQPVALPDPDAVQEDQVFISGSITPQSPLLANDGSTRIYRAAMSFIHWFTSIADSLKSINLRQGGNPTDTAPGSGNVISPGEFDSELTP